MKERKLFIMCLKCHLIVGCHLKEEGKMCDDCGQRGCLYENTAPFRNCEEIICLKCEEKAIMA